MAKKTKKEKLIENIQGYAMLIGVGLFMSFILNSLVAINYVSGESMNPTLNDRQILLGEKLTKHFNGIKRFDIVTAKVYDGMIIKRVIGLPGDQIDFENGNFYINGELLNETNAGYNIIDVPSERHPEYFSFNSVKLGDDEYFIIGDNRNNSGDSRIYGPVKRNNIISKIITLF